MHNVKNTWGKVRKVIKSNKSYEKGSRHIFPIKVLIEIINFWALEVATKIA
jgi:hypothetical protein